MKCEEFRDRLDELPDLSEGIAEEMRGHISECGDCREYFSAIGRLTPKAFPPTPANIASDVLKNTGRKERLNQVSIMKNRIAKIAAATAAAAVVIAAGVLLIGNPAPARAAGKLIDRSLAAIGGIRTMVMKIDVRTGPKDNFACIGLGEPMVGHTLTVLRGDPVRWRLDKGWRSIVFDGETKYMWSPDGLISVKGGRENRFEEWFATLLDPEMMLLREKLAAQDGATQYSVAESGGETILTARVAARGDFTNPYLLNTSIPESNTRREIVFDSRTGLLKALCIYVEDGGREVLVADVKDIAYDVAVDEDRLTEIPAGVEWNDLRVNLPAGGAFAGITAREAARMIFAAAENGDLKAVEEAFAEYGVEAFRRISERFDGSKVIGLGEPFRSGEYPGVLIPYEVRLRDGVTVKRNLALRNDNPGGVWLVDGGI